MRARDADRVVSASSTVERWGALPYGDWKPTLDTLHLYTQVVGKVRLALSPAEPNWAHVALYVTARGLTTSPIPSTSGTFEIDLDLVDHVLFLRTSRGVVERLALGGEVADFYHDLMRMLEIQHIDVAINPMPQEVADPIPFPEDLVHRTYVAEDVRKFFDVLSRVDMVMRRHRARYRGRTSPVHFFWGTFDLALARYSGRGEEAVMCGWWPGDERVPEPAFYAFAKPRPDGIEHAAVEPDGAAWSADSGEFLYPYEAARAASDSAAAVLRFLATTYAVAADLMGFEPELVAR